jgi:hypothetical protein
MHLAKYGPALKMGTITLIVLIVFSLSFVALPLQTPSQTAWLDVGV